jgi:hypothetical protein
MTEATGAAKKHHLLRFSHADINARVNANTGVKVNATVDADADELAVVA